MTTAQDIISDAYLKLGVYAPGETIIAADMTTGFNALNDLLDNWSNQSLASYANVDQSFALVNGKNSYSIGTGGDVSQTRPLAINSSPGSAYIVDTLNNVYPVTVIDQNSWNSISSRNVTGTWPQWIFYDPQYPLGIINVWPTPTAGYTLHITSRIPFIDFASQSSTVTLPPGYSLALKYNLAVELAPYFPEQSKQSLPVVAPRAKQTLGDLKRMNGSIPIATFDAAIGGVSRPYNIFIDR